METRYLALALILLTGCVAAQTSMPGDAGSRRDMRIEDHFSPSIQQELIEAVENADEASAVNAVNGGADLDFVGTDGVTPLLWTMAKGDLEGFRLLLSLGANPNVVTTVDETRRITECVMHIAAAADNVSFLEAALEHGGNPDQVKDVSSGHSPLYSAILHDRAANVELLLQSGADINHRDLSFGTPLMYAVLINAYRMASLLLERGADLSAKDRWGSDVQQLIDKYGGRGIPRESVEFAEYEAFLAQIQGRRISN